MIWYEMGDEELPLIMCVCYSPVSSAQLLANMIFTSDVQRETQFWLTAFRQFFEDSIILRRKLAMYVVR